MSANKITSGAAALLISAGVATVAVQERANARLTAEISSLQDQTSDLGSLQKENRMLTQTTDAARSLAEENQAGDALGGKIKTLVAEASGLRRQIAAQNARRRAVAGGPASAQAVDYSKVDRIPTPVIQGRPAYPFDLRQSGVGGQVLVDFVVDAAGNVRNAYAANSTSPEFEQPAVDAVSQWVFNPGQHSGRNVNTHMQVPIVFAVNDGQAGGPAAASSGQSGTAALVPFSVETSRPAIVPTDWFPGPKN
jgi:TonB family protein